MKLFQLIESQEKVFTCLLVVDIHQTLLIFQDQESYSAYENAIDADSAKKVYYVVLSKEQILQKNITVKELCDGVGIKHSF